MYPATAPARSEITTAMEIVLKSKMVFEESFDPKFYPSILWGASPLKGY